jgi:uncharacterized protein YjiS (DUF1127 family)
MAITHATSAAPFGAVAILRAVKSFSDVAENLNSWNNARITRRELSKLSERQLDDIGLARVDLF